MQHDTELGLAASAASSPPTLPRPASSASPGDSLGGMELAESSDDDYTDVTEPTSPPGPPPEAPASPGDDWRRYMALIRCPLDSVVLALIWVSFQVAES